MVYIVLSKTLAKKFKVRFCILISIYTVCLAVKIFTVKVLTKKIIETRKTRIVGLQNYATFLFSYLKSVFPFVCNLSVLI